MHIMKPPIVPLKHEQYMGDYDKENVNFNRQGAGMLT